MQGTSGTEIVWESEEEQSELIKEILSLRSERNELLDSLTPSVSRWKQIHEGEEQVQATRWRGRKEEETMPQNTASVSSGNQHHAPRSLKKEVANLFDVLLEDMDDSVHRMLSTTYVLDKTGAPLPLYKANEMVSTTSKLSHISEEFYNKEMEMDMDMGEYEDPEVYDVLFRNYLECPDEYQNELALNLTEEEKEKETEKKKKQKEKEEKWNNKTEKEKDPSTMEYLKRRMTFHQEQFTLHRVCWECVWGSNIGRCGGFKDTTTLSSMRFTHCAVPSPDSHGSTLNICSIKIINVKGNLKWPLQVYGVIAARDTLDRNRNILFSPVQHNYQVLTEKYPSLHLTGPSRAILAEDPVDFEVELKINGGAESISLRKSYYAKGSSSLYFCSPNRDCMVEISVQRLADTPVQATIVGISVDEGGWPFEHGCQVFCEQVSEIPKHRVVLLDYRGSEVSIESDGYLRLPRNVVSVDLNGKLRVAIEAYSKSGCVAQRGYVDFTAQYCQISMGELLFGKSKLKIVVAWSLVK
ncbi:unnamed protein product [Alopecurus aequalis]